MELLVATANPGKAREFAVALTPLGITVVDLTTFPGASEVEETGTTFEANARLKAETYSRRTAMPVLADDSGLEVDWLDGRPGVLSARFGGPGMEDRARCRIILKGMVDAPPDRRTARFRCVLVLARGGRTVALFEGSVEGKIASAPRGKGGFGYDPIFFHEGLGKTFAELTPEEKQAVSHRGQALSRFLDAVRAGSVRLEG